MEYTDEVIQFMINEYRYLMGFDSDKNGFNAMRVRFTRGNDFMKEEYLRELQKQLRQNRIFLTSNDAMLIIGENTDPDFCNECYFYRKQSKAKCGINRYSWKSCDFYTKTNPFKHSYDHDEIMNKGHHYTIKVQIYGESFKLNNVIYFCSFKDLTGASLARVIERKLKHLVIDLPRPILVPAYLYLDGQFKFQVKNNLEVKYMHKLKSSRPEDYLYVKIH